MPSQAEAKPRLGFSVAVTTEGYFSATLVDVTVESVQTGSPSAKAGLRVGDMVVELNGHPIKGASGLAIRKILSGVKQGDHIVLKVLRAGGLTVPIDIVAGP